MSNLQVQRLAKETLHFLKTQIRVGMTLKNIRAVAESKMLALGATGFWYWNVGAFVFAGKDTTASVSGKNYQTSDYIIGANDIITVDLSPQVGDVWGDFARTIVIENGKVISDINSVKTPEWKDGLIMEERLHSQLLKFATPATTFEELFYYINNLISVNGYKNLDFMGNLGHSIVNKKENRIYIEKGNTARLSDVEFFTFEPHICKLDGTYGLKKEDIYFFDNGILRCL